MSSTPTLNSRGLRGRLAGPAFLAAAIAVAAAFTGGDPASAAPKIRGLDPVALFPDTTTLLLGIDGRPCRAHGKELGVARIWNSPEMQQFLAPVLQMAGASIEMGLSQLDAPFDPLEALSLFTGGRTLIGMTRFEVETENRGDFTTRRPTLDFMMAVNFPPERKASATSIMDALRETVQDAVGGPEVEKTTIGGAPGWKVTLKHGDRLQPFSAIAYVVVDEWLLIGTSTSQLDVAVTRLQSGDGAKGSLLDNPTYAKCAKETFRPKTVFHAYLGLKDVLARIAKMDHGEMVMEQLEKSGVTAYNAFAWASDLDGMAVRDRFYVHGYEKSLVTPNPELDKLHALVPKGAAMASTGAMELAKTFDFLLAGALANEGPAVKNAIEQFEKRHGLDLHADVLANFGPEYGMYAAFPRYGLVPDVGFLIRTPDPAKAERTLKKAASIVGAPMRTVKHRGADLNFVEIRDSGLERGGEPIALRPTYVHLPEGYLLLTLWPQAAKNYLDGRARQDGGLLQRDDVAPLLARIRSDAGPELGRNGVMYFDVPSFVGFLIDNAAPVLQFLALPEEAAAMLELAEFPPTEVFTSNLVPFFGATRIDGEGMLVVMSSPVGIMPAYGAVAAAALAVVTLPRMHAGEADVEFTPAPGMPAEDEGAEEEGEKDK
ncbi:MAG TPA: hypothetical protein VEI02_15530 [Planctomycetota bacterium]|nr:hypothetical protein [Planctomycetota bacterium]